MIGRGLGLFGVLMTIGGCNCKEQSQPARPPPVFLGPRVTVTGGIEPDARDGSSEAPTASASSAGAPRTSVGAPERPLDGLSTESVEGLVDQLAAVDVPEVSQASDMDRGEWRVARELARRGEDAVPALREALKSRDDRVRLGAAEALARMQEPPLAAVPELTETLGDSAYAVASVAATALGKIGTKDAHVLSALASAVGGSGSDALRASAAAALASLGPSALPASGALLEALEPNLIEVPGDDLKAEQAHALQTRLGEALKALGPGLVVRLQQDLVGEAPEARSHAVVALSIIGKPELAVAPLRAQLRSAKVGARLDAARLLGTLAPSGKAAAPDLLVAVSSTNPEVRTAAAEALVNLDAVPVARAASVTAALTGGLLSESGTDRIGAAQALGQLGAAAKSAAEPLANVVAHGEGEERRAAAEALGRIGAAAQPAADALAEACLAEMQKEATERDDTFGNICVAALGRVIGAAEAHRRLQSNAARRTEESPSNAEPSPPTDDSSTVNVPTLDDATDPSH